MELNQELAELLEHSPDLESRLDAMRSFRHQEFLRIAIADLAGRLELKEVQTELTLLAETVLNKALGPGARRSRGALSDRPRAAAMRDRDGPPGLGRDVVQLRR